MLALEDEYQTDIINMNMQWRKIVYFLEYAYQPIVNAYSGEVFGYETLLRNWDSFGFDSVFELFDKAFDEQVLYALDLELRKKAIEGFKKINGMGSRVLFYNLDNRILEMPDYIPGNTEELLKDEGILQSSFYFEISERHEFSNFEETSRILRRYKDRNFRLALDDYGAGYSGLQLLYHSEPDIIKIDRFFIDGIDKDSRKKMFAKHIVNMAHLMNVQVVAEGIETREELNICRDIGCDLLQGFYISYPVTDIQLLKSSYSLEDPDSVNKRRKGDDPSAPLKEKMHTPLPITPETPAEEILKCFHRDSRLNILPVVNERNEPLGIIRESSLKKYVYSPYGISLFKNFIHSKGIDPFIIKIPCVDLFTELDKLLEITAASGQEEGILLTRNGEYQGILDSFNLLNLLNDQKILKAKDQNPLTGLPGNSAVQKKLASIIRKKKKHSFMLAYFDFDNFKPFNDTYGFRMGDRAIILFAEILKKNIVMEEHFVGHIGGDDFVVLFDTDKIKKSIAQEKIELVQRHFATNVQSYYSEEHRDAGNYRGKDRYGEERDFPLLTVSSGVLRFKTPVDLSLEEIGEIMGGLKKKAKASDERLVFSDY